MRLPRRVLISFTAAAGMFASAPAAACTAVSVYFPLGSADVNEEGRAALQQIALALAWKGPDLHHVLLTSHTDTSGSAAANRALAARRAQAVRDLLVGMEVAPNLIEVRALGEERLPPDIPQNVRDQSLRRVDLLLQLRADAQARQLEQGEPIC